VSGTGGEVTLDLRGNFAADEVVILADGREAARLAGITTRPQTGRARSLALPAGARRVTVALPRLGLSREVALPAARPLWIGADLDDARRALTLVVRTEPFGYV